PLRAKEVARVQITVAEELEQVAVDRVRTRLGHTIDSGPRVASVLRRQGAGFQLELLQRVRERERHAGGVIEIAVLGAVQQIRHSVRLTPGYRDVNASFHSPRGRLRGLY